MRTPAVTWMSWFVLWVGGLGAMAACGDAEGGADTADLSDSSETDTVDDTGDTLEVEVEVDTDTIDAEVIGDEVYGPGTRPTPPLPAVLSGDTWRAHWTDDIKPYWVSAAALGEPVGNFPTFRGMDGRVLSANERRRPRMLSRQVYTYAMGYLLTGDTSLLAHAHAGVSWLRQHAIDRVKGGCHEQLEKDGRPVAGVRKAQDLSYCVLGLAAWYFVTRDPEVEADLIAAKGWLFDQNRYWDPTKGRIRDALGDDMRTVVDVENDGGSELVAQLDAINAFMLLTQPVLSSPSERERWLADLERLGEVLVRDFLQDGIFWGVDTNKGRFGTRHVDFGHTIKSYWMLLEIDKRLAEHPFREVVEGGIHQTLARAFDAANGRWGKRPTSATAVEYGSDWWSYAELDQVAATLDLLEVEYLDVRDKTQAAWLSDYVDKRFPGEVIPSVKRDGTPAWGWAVGDDAKCNQWKNGFHSTEHALVMAIVGDALAGEDVRLHFAFAEDAPNTIARPYLFHGGELGRTESAGVTVGGRTFTPTEVRFGDVY